MEIVAPYGGQLTKTGSRQVTIKIDEMKDMVVVLDNIDLNIANQRASWVELRF